jgi:hypothetical protein
MKKSLKLILLSGAAMLFAHNALAYDPGMVEEQCKKPKFTSFSLTEYKAPEKQEVAAESAFTFAISNWIDPTSIKLLAKKKAVPFTVEDKNSFFLVESKIPAEYSGQFVRFDVIALARLGCKGLDGWLVKVAAK